ncbi:hypothetical protein [Catellatospora tritici]|uniref:hypothetical protein n=1 Tax=Catellatospora tritici TaxID=2851566 RepID=UPI001C2DAEC0|nr:hypothetical protein [Catellatospora tritici]MBV1855767.1 hypothetical protein [Catellatospora tritici]
MLLIIGAVASPLGDRLVDAIWPTPAPQPTPSAAAKLITIAQWPPDDPYLCDPTIAVAGTGPKLPDTLTPSESEDVRNMALRQLDAVVWYHGVLNMTLTGANSEPLLILAVEPKVFARHDVTPAWGLEAEPGCGGPSQVRHLQTVLDQGTVKDLGVSNGGADNPQAKAAPFGPTFTVSRGDAADIKMDVYACQGLYEFGVRIRYLDADRELNTWIGTPDKPLRLIGSWEGVHRFHSQFGSPVSPGALPAAPDTQLPAGPPAAATLACPKK